MKQQNGTLESARLIASTLANFSVVGFGLGVYEGDMWGLATACYSLAAALLIIRRINQ